LRYKTRRRVEFRDTDAAGIVHFSAFFVYMEQAEHELLRSLGASVAMQDDEGEIGWPRVSASCDYRNAARFEDELDVEVSVRRLGRTSVTYGFRFTREKTEIASGSLTAVCCRIRPGHLTEAIEIPAWLAEKLASGQRPHKGEQGTSEELGEHGAPKRVGEQGTPKRVGEQGTSVP
jgi:4-hydroxybenzoyl-CoA thioesterase/acyl-CoA thioester hydrolase